MSAAQVVPDEERRTYLGSHDTAGIAGFSPYLTPMQIYMNKTGMSEGKEVNDLMEWGTRLQPAILQKFSEVMGNVEMESERFIRHNKLRWFGGTPDATIKGKKAGVDAKNITFVRSGEWGEEGTDEIPRHLLFQCHHFLTLMDYDVWYIAALTGRSSFKVYTVERDAEMSELILHIDETFWKEHIEKRVPPPMDGSYSWRKYVERTHPKETSGVRPATSEESEWLRSLSAVTAQYKTAKEEKERLENSLAASIGGFAGLSCDFAKVSYKHTNGRTNVDGEALKAAHPQIYSQFVTIGKSGRRLRVTFNKEK